MRTVRCDKQKRIKRRRRSVDLEEQEDTTSASDISLLKGISLLFLGGMLVAVAVYLGLLALFGGTAPTPPLPVEPPPPPPTTNDTKPGHWLLWRTLDVYDKVAGWVGEYREKKRMELQLKQDNYAPPGGHRVSKAEADPWEPPQSGTPRHVPKASKKEIKRMERNRERREQAASSVRPQAALVEMDSDSDDEESDEEEGPLEVAGLTLKS